MTFRISSNTNATRLDLGVDSTIFEAVDVENDETIYVELTCDLESDCDITISVTCRISIDTYATNSILVSILPYSRLRSSNIMEELTSRLRMT